MGKPKKQSSPRKTGLRRSHLVVKLARMVNATSPVKAFTTKRETGNKMFAAAAAIAKPTEKPAAKPAAKSPAKKAAAKKSDEK
jgi:hypothetical protein